MRIDRDDGAASDFDEDGRRGRFGGGRHEDAIRCRKAPILLPARLFAALRLAKRKRANLRRLARRCRLSAFATSAHTLDAPR